MSLGIVIKGPEGLVLAAESRVTLGTRTPAGEVFHVNFDNATKLLSFSEPNLAVGAVTYGNATVGNSGRTANSFLPEFEAGIVDQGRLTISEFAEKLSEFYLKQWNLAAIPNFPGPNMVFVVGGFNPDEHFGRVYLFEIPGRPDVVEQNAGPQEFGIIWGGQRELVDRLLIGYDIRVPQMAKDVLNLDDNQVGRFSEALNQLRTPFPLQILPLQDCVDLAILFIRTTIETQRLSVGIRGVGGPIDIATITRRKGLEYVQKKEIVGERSRYDAPSIERPEPGA